uniref:TANC1/2-like winged helix domain-containing protein n=1 Tax=Meloidogyne enterolobii TaxID=390850 RepID=A0A6V7VD98_MELEN|nr:unnamed protein product [Meloidogyne enterolobii]
MIRSNPTLHQLAIDPYSSLKYSSLDLLRKLILEPINQICSNENIKRIDDKNVKEDKSSRWHDSSSSIGSCYGSKCESTTDCPSTNPYHHQQQKEKIPQFILILVDGLDEANFHQTDANESIASLLGRSINEWPENLRFVCTTSTSENSTKNDYLNIFGVDLKRKELENYFRVIQIDENNSVEDAKIFVETIMNLNSTLEKRLTSQFRRHSFFATVEDFPQSQQQIKDNDTNSNKILFSKFVINLVNRVHANFLSIHLTVDLLAEGRLSFASLSDDANLSQIYGLYFRHKFSSPANFRSNISPILSVLIASLNPLSIEHLVNILNISSDSINLENIESLTERIMSLWPLIGINPFNKQIVPMHSSLREWLLNDRNNTEYSIDIRNGHILIALWIVTTTRRNTPKASSEQLFELAHHLLKANPHKYAQPELVNSKIGIKMPWGRDAQIKWLKLATEEEGNEEINKNSEIEENKEEKEKSSKLMENALLYRPNIFYTNSKISKLLLLAGANPNAHQWSNEESEPLLSAFTRAGNVEMIKLLLKFGANPNFGSPTPLLIALQHQNFEIIKVLCNFGADPFNKLNSDGDSLLLYCVKNNYSCDIISVLLNYTGKVMEEPHELLNSTKFFPQSSSSSTFSFDNTEEIKLFKSTQSDGSANKSIAINEAFQAATERGFTSICSLFLEYDKNQEKPILDTSGALSTACINSHSDLIQLFLSRGIQPPQNGNISWKGRLALNCAVESGCLDLVVKILNNEGNTIINEQEGPEGFTPLITAAKQGRVGLVDLLVNRGANMDKTDIQGRSAIFHALEDGHFSTAGLLLEKGCNPCIADINENTLLHILAKRPNRGLIGQLLEMGISLEGRNGKGLRPIEVAIQNAQLQAVDIFLRRGARLRSLTWQIAFETHPPLVLMLLRKLLEDAQFLLRRRRNIEAEHRFTYALQKFGEIEKFGEKYLKKENLNLNEEGEEEEEEEKYWKEKETEFNIIQSHVKKFKIHTLHSMAALKRKANRIEEAINLISEAIEIINKKGINEESTSILSSDEEDVEFDNLNTTENIKLKCQQQRLFELHLLRAKCHFDARNMSNARLDAHFATSLRPEDQEAKSLAAILNIN